MDGATRGRDLKPAGGFASTGTAERGERRPPDAGDAEPAAGTGHPARGVSIYRRAV